MKKIVKNFLASMMIVLTVLTCVPLSGFVGTDWSLPDFSTAVSAVSETGGEKAAEITQDAFLSEMSRMVNEYDEEGYFSKIIIDVEKNTIKTDNAEEIELSDYGVDYGELVSPEPMIAAEPLLDILGSEAEIDTESGDIVVSSASQTQNDIAISGYVQQSTDTASEENTVYFTQQQLQEELYLESEYEDGKITVTNPYQTKRIMVHTEDASELTSYYGAVDYITDGDGYYILQYETPEDTKFALQKFQADEKTESAVCDVVVAATAIEDRPGAELIQSDRYKTYLKSNGKTSKITVAVVDTGADTTHPFLKNRMVTGYDVFEETTKVTDAHGHGTHVSGIVADNTPSSVKIMPITVLDKNGYGTGLAFQIGVEYAIRKKVDVINMSLGAYCGGDGCPICEAVDKAISKGITVVTAAGNDNCNTKDFCPAKITECVTVASCRAPDGSNQNSDPVTSSSFSNYGTAVDITAPGEVIMSCEPGGGYVYMSGTSMASPFVAAAAAMILTDNSSLSPAQVEKKLKSYTSDFLLTGWDKYSGEGILDFGVFFGDDVKPEKIYSGIEELSLDYFTKAKAYYLTPVLENDSVGVHLTDRSFTTTSSNKSVAYFDGRYVVPKSEGTATITIKIANGESTSFKVNVTKKEVWVDYAASKYAGGKGTKSSPYLISNAAQLTKFAVDMRNGNTFEGKYLKLTNDIDLAGKYWITAAATSRFEVNFDSSVAFRGTFDGGNRKIKNMTVLDESASGAWGDSNPINWEWFISNTGFIFAVEGGVVKNLGIENAYAPMADGALLIHSVREESTVLNCYTSGYSSGSGMFWDICNYDIRISDCYSSATVLKSGIVYNSYASADPRGKVVMSNVFFCGEQLSNDYDKTTAAFAARITGYKTKAQNYVYNCFSACDSPTENGFAYSKEYAYLYKCYYNKANSESVRNNKTNHKTQLSAKSDSFFKSKSSFTNSKNWNSKYPWDFEDTWAIDPKINDGYPYLKNNKPDAKKPLNTGTWLDYASDSFAGGKGTQNSPYIISNANELARLAYIYRFGGGEGAYYVITNDIDLSAHEWMPVGCGTDVDSGQQDDYTKHIFFGNVDGNGKTISGLRVKSEGDYIGLFARLNTGSIKNLNVVNADVEGYYNVGILCGEVRFDAVVENCSVSGTVKGEGYVGGIAGIHRSSSIISSCTSTADVESEFYSAGIAGEAVGPIQYCSYAAPDGADGNFAGIAGCTYGDVISNCYSVGKPIFKEEYGSCNIINSYQVLAASQGNEVYFDSVGGVVSTELTDAQMKTADTFQGFDFADTWAIDESVNGGYPYLKTVVTVPAKEKLPTKYWKDYAASSFAGGKGTKKSPYLIATAEQLAYFKVLCDDGYFWYYDDNYFRLIRDIDLEGKIWSSKQDAGYFNLPVYFDGNNKTIYNMTTKNGAGFLDYNLEGEIKNLRLVNVKGENSCGIVPMNSGIIKNCYVSGYLSAQSVYTDPMLSASFASGITENNYSVIEKCTVDVVLRGAHNVAGITGYNTGTITDCLSMGEYYGAPSYPIAGNNVSGEDSISNCLSVAKYSGSDNDHNDSCHFVSDETDLKDKNTYVGWDFDSVWAIDPDVNGGYPYLRGKTSYKITYKLNGGKKASYMQNDYISGNIVELKTPTKTDMNFEGWYKDADFETKVSKIGSSSKGDITLYAKWSKGIGRPDTVKATSTGDSVKLSWSAVKGATGYRVQVYKSGWKTVQTSTSRNCTVEDLKSGTEYRFRIKAYAKKNNETEWAPSYEYFYYSTKPSAPKNVEATQTESTVTLSWSKSSGATGYRVFQRVNGKWKTLKNTTATSFKVTGLKAGTEYTFAVRPYIDADYGRIWASKYCKINTATKPVAPTVKLASTKTGRATIAWSDVSGETGYQVRYSTKENSGYKTIASCDADTAKVYKTGLTSGKIYYFKVRAYKTVNGKKIYGTYSAVKSVKIK